MIITEITPARIGRSMNSLEKPMLAIPSTSGQRLDVPVGRSDLGAGSHALHPVDHDSIVALQAGAHDAQASLEIPRLHHARLRDIVFAHDPHESPRLVAQDRTVRNEQRIELAGAEELKAPELPGGEEATRIGDQRATAY